MTLYPDIGVSLGKKIILHCLTFNTLLCYIDIGDYLHSLSCKGVNRRFGESQSNTRI